ncbi:hypothetical protein [Bradyrhizobium retamae]|uniref:Uncharacterized protein n=1 Tax=Bradyrhizobium retamae TaxID=1300035 RepID=A0A0R3MNU5_9BRAD|nr:hypothetical protein [Bradyrhizobium retamae]KRR21691.1 hypothetical protein CQ13_06470 [Bradyrhizobium retamae]
MTLSAESAVAIRNRETALRNWLGNRTSYHPSELPADIIPPTNEERSALEVFEFLRDKPARYFLYINREKGVATTWTGEVLGRVTFGREYRDNFGGKRIAVRIAAISGDEYHGTYFVSSGDYARVQKVKRAESFQMSVEYTDTFGGEANYCWVKRETLTLPVGATDRQIMRAAKLAMGLNAVRGRLESHGDGFAFYPYRSATVMFVQTIY